MKRCLFIYLIILSACIAPLKFSFSQSIFFNEGHKKSTIPFKLVNNLVIIEMKINGSEPLNFILDSGVGPMIISDPAIVDTLQTGNSILYPIRGRGIGPELEAYLINNVKVTIGKHASGNLTVVLLKDDPFKLSFFLGIPVHGIIGSDFFTSFKVRLNYTRKKLTFYNFDVATKGYRKRIPLKVIGAKPYIDIALTEENGKIDSLLLLVDTGAGHAVSLDLSDENKGIQPNTTIPANLGIGLSGPISGFIGRVNNIKFGDFSFSHVITAFPHYEDEKLREIMTKQDGSIGGEILRRFNLFFDYSKSELSLNKNRNYKEPFEYDMSGIEIYVISEDGVNRFFISRIEKDSPAEQVGLEVDDEIISSGLKKVQDLSLDGIYDLFKYESKNALIIEVLRGDDRYFKFLTLKRRI
jgi:hypothetical protein